MNREIKFRGKDIKTGEWVYGFYYELKSLNENKKGYIVIGTENILSDNEIKISPVIKEVDIKTIGRYTGLNDEEGKEIYEGDIVKYTPMNSECLKELGIKGYDYLEVEWGGYSDNEYVKSVQTWMIGIDPLSDVLLKEEIERVGNIYDNKELLK